MVTLSLFAMGGVLGLAVDFGWSYYVKKSAQAAADAAALSAAYQALATVGQTVAITSDLVTVQATPASCDLSGNLHNGCLYAQQNGFAPGGHGGRQAVTMVANLGSATPPPTVPGVIPDYWVTARAVETVPQLFSAILGNATGVVSARATAAIMSVVVNGSLITLNRAGDGASVPNIDGLSITAPNGVIVANSSNSGTNRGISSTVGTIAAPIIGLNPLADPKATGETSFQHAPDGPEFLDPMRGLGQPQLPTAPLNTYAVMGGNLAGTIYVVDGINVTGTLTLGAGTIPLPSGNYFPAICASHCTSDPIGTVSPVSGGLTTGGGTVTFLNGGFGNFLFYGGLSNTGTLNMGPGQYVVVGGGLNDIGVLQDINSGSDAGQIIIVTGSSGTVGGSFPSLTNNAANNLYPGLVTQLNSNLVLAQMATNSTNSYLAFGQTILNKSADGSGPPSGLNLNLSDPAQAALAPFQGVVFWQDQANSSIKYTPNGNIDVSCGDINSPCKNAYSTDPTTPNIQFYANGGTLFNGVMYQPRGSSITSFGSGTISGNLMMITGAYSGSSGASLNLSSPPIPLKRRIAALIE